MRKQHCFLFLIVLCHWSTMILAHCPPGYYDNNVPHESRCILCGFGQYCPGNGQYFNCPSGTIAPNTGMSSCTKCSYSNRTNSASTVCLLADTPNNAQEALEYGTDSGDDNLDLFKISAKQQFYFTTIETADIPLDRSHPIQYSFVATNRKYDIPLIVIASTKTGQPSKSNFQWIASGQNATLIIPVDWIDTNTNFIGLYFSIIPSVDYTVPFLATTFKHFRGEIFAIPNRKVSQDFKTFQFMTNQAVVEWSGIPSLRKVNVSVTLSDLTHQDDSNLFFSLCYSTIPTIDFPNFFNSNMVVRGKVNNQINIILENISGGKLKLGVVGGLIDLARITAELVIL
ncbi:predicted protein [Naegleria gruberi]|uniref:Predicted protein n=1 Tax=Naegleria gruberi TaxID=5762 RepID=D2VGN4_NAEGR|nr:uncharacterized protein NAEGRDRAFT_68040 [Naegleria gruberi]EFC43997.1 predicted protein [Naegleria gruberi]|eukprot:XP_002676741.1 predicted protein [Naegleria gruberi strain NEG-M]